MSTQLKVIRNLVLSITRFGLCSLFACSFVFCSGLAAHADDLQPLTLDQALRDFEVSPRVERAASVKEEASWKKVELLSGFLPKISANASRIIDDKLVLVDIPLNGQVVSITQILPTTTYSLGVDWTLFDGFANMERFEGAKALESASQKDLEWAKFQGQRDVVLLFYRALATQTLKEVAEANLKTLEDHLNDVRLFKQAGAGTKFDVLRVEVQTSEAKSEVLNQTDNVTISLLRLGEQLGLDIKSKALNGKLPVLGPELVANLKYDETKRGDLDAMKARLESVSRGASASSRYWIPRVGVGGQYQQYNNLTNDVAGPGFRSAYIAAVNLQWNLYDGGVSNSREHQAVEQKVQAERSLMI
jgi:outer membrane protein TolC